jgi:hypothetical protein
MNEGDIGFFEDTDRAKLVRETPISRVSYFAFAEAIPDSVRYYSQSDGENHQKPYLYSKAKRNQEIPENQWAHLAFTRRPVLSIYGPFVLRIAKIVSSSATTSRASDEPGGLRQDVEARKASLGCQKIKPRIIKRCCEAFGCGFTAAKSAVKLKSLYRAYFIGTLIRRRAVFQRFSGSRSSGIRVCSGNPVRSTRS